MREGIRITGLKELVEIKLAKWRTIQAGRTAGTTAQGTWCLFRVNLTVKEDRGVGRRTGR